MARALGRYELLRPLARGGMAEVYLARRRAGGIEKWLVVKRMRPERTGDPRFLDLFVREARLSMSLVHQNIVPVFDFGRIDDQVFLAMERVEGKDLGSSLQHAPSHRMPPLLAAFVAAECCQALDYAHQRKSPEGVALGIVHRDVTPRNVLLSWSGEVKLTDFGIAALAGDAHARLLGTPQYMAPEQARSEAIDPRTDIYAVGLVLREAITGVRPRPGGDRDAILDAARRGELVPWCMPPGELALGTGDHGEPPADDTAPAPLVAIVDRATAAAPGDRYPDARSMLEDLDAFIVAERAAHRAESPARQLGAWLAGVWGGAHDPAASDAGIDADHLVSFLDDGAIDVIGTGTMRSMAATAAEDVHAADDTRSPPAPTPAPAPPEPPIAPPPAAAPPPAPAPAALVHAARGDGSARASRISSSTSTVASGSFHTLPTAHDRRSRGRGRARAIAPIASLVVVAVIAGGSVFWVMTGLGHRGGSAPTAALAPPGVPVAPAAVPAAAAGAAGAPIGPAHPGSAAADASPSPTAGRGAPDRGSADERPTGDPPRDHRTRPAAAATDATASDRRRAPAAGAAAPSSPPAIPARPGPGRASAGVEPSHLTDLPSPAARPPPAPADRPRPPTCRVRFNLTPWAYFTADDDGTRHETPATIDLAPGLHRLHVWNPELHIERDIVLSVPADRDTMNYSEPLRPSSLPPDGAPR